MMSVSERGVDSAAEARNAVQCGVVHGHQRHGVPLT